MTTASQLIQPSAGIVPEDDGLAEARQLICDLRDAARDSRRLADRYADLLRSVVEEYCGEFEQRAIAVLARLETR
jgi:hypothetical protein